MQKLLGLVIIFACVVGGFLMSGGRLASFWQPGEIIIILGAGFGALVLANPKPVLAEM
ncbi:Chemotaxis protein MotA [Cedecea neteri]|nr:Chemotaxis protein MotA [Cedecea neteri]